MQCSGYLKLSPYRRKDQYTSHQLHHIVKSPNSASRTPAKTHTARQCSNTEKQSVGRSTRRTARIRVHDARSRIADLAARPHHSRAVAESAAPTSHRICQQSHPLSACVRCGNSLHPANRALALRTRVELFAADAPVVEAVGVDRAVVWPVVSASASVVAVLVGVGLVVVASTSAASADEALLGGGHVGVVGGVGV